ncbi:hypothetical protein FHG87_010273 [Trinorchestia longiramus]|nr:hypothetical protein FHG87_010273 [Trinorchestia longiramus]
MSRHSSFNKVEINTNVRLLTVVQATSVVSYSLEPGPLFSSCTAGSRVKACTNSTLSQTRFKNSDNMNGFFVLLLALMPALSTAAVSTFGDCLPGSINNGRDAGVAANFAKIKGMGELAIVGRDPTNDESGNSCQVLTLRSDMNYEFRFQNEDGETVTHNGTFQEQRRTVPILNTQDSYAELDDLPTSVLNGGALFPIVYVQDEIILQTCRIQFPNGVRSTYVLVPLAKAKANLANAGCGCDDWSSA